MTSLWMWSVLPTLLVTTLGSVVLGLTLGGLGFPLCGEQLGDLQADGADPAGAYQELLADLRACTGLPVTGATVGRMDFLRDTPEVTIYYKQPVPAATPPPPQTCPDDAAAAAAGAVSEHCTSAPATPRVGQPWGAGAREGAGGCRGCRSRAL
jgi:hypothetical protein